MAYIDKWHDELSERFKHLSHIQLLDLVVNSIMGAETLMAWIKEDKFTINNEHALGIISTSVPTEIKKEIREFLSDNKAQKGK